MMLDRFAALRARRAARPEFVKTSQARIWRITFVAIVAIAGLTVAFIAFLARTSTLNRLGNDERCLRSVVAANTQRSALLTKLNTQLNAADQTRQNWNTAEQRIFGLALDARTPADRARVRREFARANAGYLAADDHYRRLDGHYKQAVKDHPPARLKCQGPLAPSAVSTVISTATTTATATTTRSVPAPGPRVTMTRTLVRPGSTFTTVVVGPTATRTVVRTVPPHTRTVTTTATATRTVLPLPLPTRICKPIHLC